MKQSTPVITYLPSTVNIAYHKRSFGSFRY